MRSLPRPVVVLLLLAGCFPNNNHASTSSVSGGAGDPPSGGSGGTAGGGKGGSAGSEGSGGATGRGGSGETGGSGSGGVTTGSGGAALGGQAGGRGGDTAGTGGGVVGGGGGTDRPDARLGAGGSSAGGGGGSGGQTGSGGATGSGGRSGTGGAPGSGGAPGTGGNTAPTPCSFPSSWTAGGATYTTYVLPNKVTACGYNDNGNNTSVKNIVNAGHFAAIPGNTSSDFNTSNRCGACIQIGSAIVTIVDECPNDSNPPCKSNPTGHMDLSGAAASAGGVKGDPAVRGQNQWKYVPCPVTGNVIVRLKSGNNNEIFIENEILPIASVTCAGQNGSRTSYGAWHFNSNVPGASCEVTDIANRKITITVGSTQGQDVDTKVQFPKCQ